MTAMLCRPPGSYFCTRASSQDPTSADSHHPHKPQSVKPPPVHSPSPVVSHSVAEKPKTDLYSSSSPSPSSSSSSSPSHGSSLPLPLPLPLPIHLPIHLPLPLPRSVFPSPLKFLWFHRENSLEKDAHEKEAQEEGQEHDDPLSLTSAPRLGDDDSSAGLESFAETGEESTSGRGDEEENDAKEEKSKSWVPNLVNLTYLWRKYGFEFPSKGGGGGGEEDGGAHMRIPGSCQDCGCEDCGGDHYLQSKPKLKKSVMSFEVPVVHDKDSFGDFLHRVHLPEVMFIRRMSFLANQAYYIPELKKDELLKHHRLRFVTSSLERKARLAAKEKAVLEAKEKQAGASETGHTAETESHNKTADGVEKKENEKQEASLGPAQATYAMAATAASYLAHQTKSLLPFKGSTSERKALKEEVEVLAASNQPKETGSKELKTPKIPEGEGDGQSYQDEAERLSVVDEGVPDLKALEESGENAENVSDGLAPVATAAAATGLVSAEDETKDAVAQVLQSDAWCPSEWFVCDEEGTSRRYFVIQGSDSLASWQANLLFESSFFEDPEWGVMVHRGIYEAAKGLYEQLLPLIQAHADTHGDKARFYFTGHSLGGSLATLLTLMLQHRGVLPVSAMLPVYTFGSPSIMCGGDWLLEKLGFPLSHVQSVVMHYDIVPRTFACHYPDQVVEVLKRLNGTFRKHACLQQQNLMYAPMGKMLVLQPDQQQAPRHPFLPTGSALYHVRHPNQETHEISLTDPHSPATAQAKEVRSAERSFLNTPHPLEILTDPGSYGAVGTISRDHDSASYLRAVNTALREEFKKWRSLNRDQRRKLWGPLMRTKSGKRLHRLGSDLKALTENGAIAAERGKLRRSLSFLETEENVSKRDAVSDSQMEPSSR